MKHHTELLNFIASQINAKSYLEIGVCHPDHNFNKINVEFKYGVDPDPKAHATYEMTSDKFFKLLDEFNSSLTFDLIWIDGLHESEQVKRDFENALRYLKPGGVICFHDCNPPTEATACYPRGAQREWCGNTWRMAAGLAGRADVDRVTIDMDYGCMVVFNAPVGKYEVSEITWDEFDANRQKYLNLKSVDEFVARFKVVNEIEA
jgi:SAM-dependent methyltransferase